MRTNRRCVPFIGLIAMLVSAIPMCWPQQGDFDRGRYLDMLNAVAGDVRKNYYDPKFHGVDWDATVRETRDKIQKATSVNMALAHIAAALDTLNDSHTFFLPPPRPYRHDYGWRIRIIGDRCYVTQVRPGSDAEAKGVKPGDEVVAINGHDVDRTNLWKMEYVLNALRPQAGLRAVVRDPAGNERELEIMAKVRQLKRTLNLASEDLWNLVREGEDEEQRSRIRYQEFDTLLIVKIPEFTFSDSTVDALFSKARKHSALVLDLRGNPGGYVDSLQWILGGFCDKELKIGDRVGRNKSKPSIAKPRRQDRFDGKLIVLVDSQSASAAEIFARVIQLQKSGTVLGDRSAGSVMEGKFYGYESGIGTVLFYGASITDADLIMADGRSLEHVGVTPDMIVLPTATDLANRRDPVLARAAELAGVKLSPEEAGSLFPYQWPRN